MNLVERFCVRLKRTINAVTDGEMCSRESDA